MKNKVLICTTPEVSGNNVIKQLGIISATVVMGTSWIKEFKASFSDVFGGVSKSFTNEVENCKYRSLEKLRIKAQHVGANCILQTRIDVEPIAGNGFTMFMVTATGTAVEIDNYIVDSVVKEDSIVSVQQKLDDIYKKTFNMQRTDISKTDISIETMSRMTYENLSEIVENNPKAYASELVEVILLEMKKRRCIVTKQSSIENIKILIKILDKDIELIINDILFNNITSEKVMLAKKIHVINYETILNNLKGNISESEIFDYLDVLSTVPNDMTTESYRNLKKLVEYLNSKYKEDVIIKSSGLLQKTGKWECKNCKQLNSIETELCYSCSTNKFGIKASKVIDNTWTNKLDYKSIYKYLDTILVELKDLFD